MVGEDDEGDYWGGTDWEDLKPYSPLTWNKYIKAVTTSKSRIIYFKVEAV